MLIATLLGIIVGIRLAANWRDSTPRGHVWNLSAPQGPPAPRVTVIDLRPEEP